MGFEMPCLANSEERTVLCLMFVPKYILFGLDSPSWTCWAPRELRLTLEERRISSLVDCVKMGGGSVARICVRGSLSVKESRSHSVMNSNEEGFIAYSTLLMLVSIPKFQLF